MSINDILNDDNFLLFLYICMAIAVIITIPAFLAGMSRGKKVNRAIFGEDENIATVKCIKGKVLSKTAAPHPLNAAVMINYIVFELQNDIRVELAIKDISTYNTIMVGDSGFLTYRGKQFIKFERLIGDET